MSASLTRGRQWFGIFLLFAAQLGLAIALSQRPKWSVPPQAAGSRNPRLFEALSFGHLPLAVDWIWLGILQDDSIERLPSGQHGQHYYDLDLLTDLDPAFFDAYESGANLLAVVRNDGLGAKDILLKGEGFRKAELPKRGERFKSRFWNREWSLPLLLAYTFLFELNDLPSAAVHFRDAAQIAGAPPYLASLAERLSKPGGEYAVGLRLINYMIDTATEARVRDELKRKRESLYLAQYLADLNRSFQHYLLNHPPSRESIGGRWRQFLRENAVDTKDPWGGTISLNDQGKIVSTTPHVRVFGLE